MVIISWMSVCVKLYAYTEIDRQTHTSMDFILSLSSSLSKCGCLICLNFNDSVDVAVVVVIWLILLLQMQMLLLLLVLIICLFFYKKISFCTEQIEEQQLRHYGKGCERDVEEGNEKSNYMYVCVHSQLSKCHRSTLQQMMGRTSVAAAFKRCLLLSICSSVLMMCGKWFISH